MQFDNSVDVSGHPIWRTDTTAATVVIQEDCSGCGLTGWGWNDNGYGTNVLGPLVLIRLIRHPARWPRDPEGGWPWDRSAVVVRRHLQDGTPLGRPRTTRPSSRGHHELFTSLQGQPTPVSHARLPGRMGDSSPAQRCSMAVPATIHVRHSHGGVRVHHRFFRRRQLRVAEPCLVSPDRGDSDHRRVDVLVHQAWNGPGASESEGLDS